GGAAVTVGERGGERTVLADRKELLDQVAGAARTRPLAVGAPFAAARGLRHPVAQGPMTRVSDRAAFARAIADEGGLPFLALALMSGEDSRALLTQTADLLGDAPWGVGVLGFAPADLRNAQLAAVRDVRPPCAIVAGGRPAQAASLEAAGTETFLHVPSPRLLHRFLADGARKFVFEGRECGGHVGPRASFPLWEAQIAGLLAFGESDQAGPDFFAGLHLLFAGGVHDARSAAMVAAAAAPLAERGAGIGVLMGTAYLFTDEAVASGAILPGFQQAALDCERTVLLETSPGHATRCVESAYVHTFLDRRRELLAAATPRQQMWEELEALNLGRLRVASKGLRRDGGEVVQVGPAAQARDGMFMIGQVAALRSDRTSVAALHDEVTTQATAALAGRAAELGVPAGPELALGSAGGTRRPAGGSQNGADMDGAGTGGGGRGRATGAAGRAVTAVTAAAATEGDSRPAGQPLDIAIVGMAAIFPDAPDLASFWANVVAGNDAIREVPADRWDPEVYYRADAVVKDAGRRTPSKWGGFLPRVPFDALAYGIPPRSLRSIETSQLLALEVATRALRGAGYDTGQKAAGEGRPFDRSRASVVFGTEAGTDLSGAYGLRSLWPGLLGPLPAELDEFLPELDEDSFPGMLANVIAGRVANRLDFGGVNFTVDAACASSLAALDAGCKELLAGSSDLVLCGGVDTHAGAHDFLLFSSVHALSPGGRCRSFDAGADGTSLGEGAAAVVLKRLADAERDGDRIHAVIRAVAGSSDGRALGLTAPRKAGQVLSLERAYTRAGISPSDVGLLEAHATGTVVGDRTELATLTEVFTDHGATPGQCAVGSVKSQIGHTKCAAGLAGLIKAAKAVETGVRPPTLHIDTPNTYWDADTSPFYFDEAAKPWAAPPGQRHAGVSAFGFGGTNFHVVLSAYDGGPEPAHGLDQWPAELFAVRGADRAAAGRALDRLAALVGTNDDAGRPFRLRDLARTTCAAGGGPVQVAFVVEDLDGLPAAIEAARTFTANPRAGLFVRNDTEPGATAFLFPGQGSQRPGMLADLFVAFPRLRAVLDLAPQWVGTMFPPAAFTREQKADQVAAITDTRAAQPTLGLAGLAVHDLLTGLGVRPDHVGGHSYGELIALCAAGALDRADLVGLSEARAAAILAAAGDGPGTMAAVQAPVERVREVLAGLGGAAGGGHVVIANHNAPRQCVISGPTAAVAEAVAALGRAGLTARPIPVACAFHSPVVAAAAGTLADRLAALDVAVPALPVWSNTTAEPYPSAPEQVRATLAGQVAAPVRFDEQIEAMYAAGVRTFVEAGPGRVLSQLVGKILDGRPHRVVATDVAGESGLRRLLFALAELAAAGVGVDSAPLFTGRDARMVSATDVPRRPGWLIDGAYVRTADGRFLPGGLRPPTRLARALGPGADDPATPATAAPADATAASTASTVRPSAAPPSVEFSEIAGVRGFVSRNPAPPLVPADPTDDPAVLAAGLPELGGGGPVDAVVLEFLRTTRELVAAQRDVVLGYLGYDPTGLGRPAARDGIGAVPAVPHQAQPGQARTAGTAATAPAPRRPVPDSAGADLPPVVAPAAATAPAAPAARPAALDRSVVLDAVVGVIGDQTGYPVEMLEPDLDLEADLSIDSIKRTEILGELAARLGLVDAGSGELDEEVVEELAAIKTVRGIVDWIVGSVSGGSAPSAASGPGPASASTVAAAVIGESPEAIALRRFVVEPEILPAPAGAAPVNLSGSRFLLVEGGLGVGLALATRLEQAGAEVRILAADDAGLVDQIRAGVGTDGLIWIASADPDADEHAILPGAFPALQAAALGGSRRVLIATGDGGRFGRAARPSTTSDPRAIDTLEYARRADAGEFTVRLTPGAGLAGLVRTIAREVPGLVLRLVDVEPKDEPRRIADSLLAELLTPGGPLVVGYRDGVRATPRVRPAGADGAGDLPAGLGPSSVVLLTGGARGITAAVAIELARRSGCAVELIGRTTPPAGPEDPATAGAADAPALRRALIETGVRRPAEIEARVARLLAEREVRATLAILGGLASSVRYHAVDVRDGAAVAAVVAGVYARRGRLDGLVHGAGLLADRLLRDKTPESFDRVYRTKVDGARALLAAVRDDVGFVALFGSVAGVFGNRGQADYAAANDALDTLASAAAGRFAGRVVSVDWGPWASPAGAAGGGMVSVELAREYARRGIGLIDPAVGVAALLRELAGPSGGPAQVVYMCADLGSFDA
ncbi:type I polyketide synthase, partial [Candidatus Frankia alpina]